MSKKPWSLNEWFAFGETGLSSEAMMLHLYGTPGRTDLPRDPADFRRCRLALENTNSEHMIEKAATISPKWASLVKQWPRLCELMDKEIPEWRDSGGYSIKLYREIQKAIA